MTRPGAMPPDGAGADLSAAEPSGLPLGTPTPWEPTGKVRADRGEVLRYLGYSGQDLSRELEERIEGLVREAEDAVSARGSWAVWPVAPGPDEGTGPLRLAGSTVELKGSDIAAHLAGAGHVALLACTLGFECERHLRRAMARSALDGAVADAACSALVEAATEHMDRMVGEAARGAGLGCTRRFSPGYGNLPLSSQGAIVASLNARRLCGISVTAEDLLTPTKSVTALIGLTERPGAAQGRSFTCATCALSGSCPFRERGLRCFSRA